MTASWAITSVGPSDYHDFDIHGVTFYSPTIGMFVGKNKELTAPDTGFAVLYNAGVWT